MSPLRVRHVPRPCNTVFTYSLSTHAEAKDGLLFAINSDAIANYPDRSRIDDVRNFYEEHVKNADSSEKFIVWFG